MSAITLNKEMTVKDVLDRWPETLDVFIANGFDNFRDEKQRNAVGAYLKLDRAAQTKNYDLDNFLALLQDKIDEELGQIDVTMKATEKDNSQVTVSGYSPAQFDYRYSRGLMLSSKTTLRKPVTTLVISWRLPQ